MTVVRLEDYEQELELRKAALGFAGNDYVLPNAGGRRTREKRALLQLIETRAAENGVTSPFKSNL
jgi:hypothetical protein